MIRTPSAAAGLLACAAVPACIPSRDNPHDPANIPNAAVPEIVVRIATNEGELVTAVGQRHSRWILDGTDSAGPGGGALPEETCFEWAVSERAADDPELLADEEWAALFEADADCLPERALVFSTGNEAFAAVLSQVTDFQSSTGVPDGTGSTTRWVRLVLATPNGARAASHKLLTVVNEPPVVRLGPDRRTAPGGRWWLPDVQRPFTNVVVASVDDPDPLVEVRWVVTGELATRLDLAPSDGFVDDAFLFDSNGSDDVANDRLRLEAPMSIHPSRSEVTLVVRDVDVPGAAAGSDSVRLDVLTTVWAYNRGTGHLRYLDTSQFAGDFQAEKTVPLATQGDRILVGWSNNDGSVNFYSSERTLGRNVVGSNVAGFDVDAVAASPDGAGGWWVLAGEENRLYRLDATGTTLTAFSDDDVDDNGYTDFHVADEAHNATAPGPGGTVWVIGGEATLATQSHRVYLVESDGTVAIPKVDPFGDDTDTEWATDLVADGSGGVWVRGATGRLAHITAGGTRTEHELPAGCDGRVNTLAVDPARGVLWAGVFALPTRLLCRLSAQDLSLTTAPQPIASIGEIAIDPVDGSSLMISNDGAGISRYHPLTGASLEYVPVNKEFVAKGLQVFQGNLLVSAAQATRPKRILMIEGAEIFRPNNLVPGVDPYLFDVVRHVSDPVTGFVWVWRPDDGKLSAYAPSGELVQEAEVPVREKRAHLAFDPDARRLWFAWSNLYNPTDPVADGRLYSIDVSFELPVDPEDPAQQLVATSSASIQIVIAQGLGVVPSSAPSNGGRVCLVASDDGSEINDAMLRTLQSDGTPWPGETEVAVAGGGQNALFWAAGDPSTGACWFGELGVGSEVYVRLPDNSSPSYGMGVDTREAVFVGGGEVWAASQGDTWLVRVKTPGGLTALSADPLQDPLLDAFPTNLVGSSTADPYWRHAWVGVGDADAPATGEVVRVTLGDEPVEAWREEGFYFPILRNGR